ncbi:MAG: TOBE domain-containing protein, partial [Halobacteriaceae archaeon]
IRPEYINIKTDNTDITCTVNHCIREERGYRVTLEWEGQTFEALTQDKCEAGSAVAVEFQADKMHFLNT